MQAQGEFRQKWAVKQLGIADDGGRREIYRIRHAIYAMELGQHPPNQNEELTDALDATNNYLVARRDGELAGFISITPPGAGRYSIDKYIPRERLPFPCDRHLFEIRLLTVIPKFRHSEAAFLLMYAALRWIEARGGTRIVAIGRQEILSLYYRVGLEPTGLFFSSGKVGYELLHASVARIHAQVPRRLLNRLEPNVDWQVGVSFRPPASCFHGGSFFSAIGEKFEHLERSASVINADVLDAWFPPSPRVVAALSEYLPWLVRTSPPNDARGLAETVAVVRGVGIDQILPGAGSSSLIFLAFTRWLNRKSRVLILDPIYSEYAHVLEKVIGCQIERFLLHRSDDYDIDLGNLERRLAVGYDLVVLVNPNSPTGRHVPADTLRNFLRRVPSHIRVWIDETYSEYAGAGQSVESYAAESENVIVCKSMSKVYALSGVRVAYLCAGQHQLEELRAFTPPWAVSLPAQIAGVKALEDPEYYARCYSETHLLRHELTSALREFGWETVPGVANFILAHLPGDGPSTEAVLGMCRRENLFLRNPANMGSQFGDHAIRIAVKDRFANQKMVGILRACLKIT